jgi:hypothetical protein
MPKLLYVEPIRRRMRLRFGGTWIADSEYALALFEPGRYRVRRAEDTLTLEVEDGGRRLPAAMLEQLRAAGAVLGVGIAGRRELLQHLGGALAITSGEHGTIVHASVPLTCEPT